MSAPTSSGGPSPMRVGGLALIGVGAVAGLIGLATLLPSGGSDSGSNSAAPASSAAVAPPADATATETPAPAGTVPVPAFVTPTNDIAAPGGSVAANSGSGSGGSASGVSGSGGSDTAAVRAPLRVYNNSTIKGLAARAADDFRGDGWPVDAVANYPYGTISTSTVYYRPGTSEEATASALGSAFGLRVLQRFAGLDDATPGVIVIVTNDYQRR